MKQIHSVPLAFIFSLGVTTAQAGLIAQYTFEGDSVASSDNDLLTTASDFTESATGTGYNSEFGRFSTEDIDGSGPDTTTSRASGWSARVERYGNNTFFEFTIELAPGTTQIEFDSLTFEAKVRDTLNSGPTAFDYNLFWDVNGFASTIATATGPSASGAGLSQSAYTPISMNLSSLSAQPNAVTFRLDPVFAAGAATNGGYGQRRGALDNVSLSGTASVIPEPSSLAMFGIGALGLFGYGRRRRQKSAAA